MGTARRKAVVVGVYEQAPELKSLLSRESERIWLWRP